MEKSKTNGQTPDLATTMQVFAQSLAQECMRHYSPAMSQDKQNKVKPYSAIRVACLHVIKFRQKNPFGLLGVIRLIKMIRRDLKKLNYDSVFVNDVTIALVQSLLHKPK